MRLDMLIQRSSVNKLNVDITKKNLKRLIGVVERNKSNRLRGICGKLNEPEKVTDEASKKEVWLYKVKLRVVKRGQSSPEVTARHLEHAKKLIQEKCNKYGWEIIGNVTRNGEDQVVGEVKQERPQFEAPVMTPDSISEITRGIYDRDQHVRVIHDGVVDFFDTLNKHHRNESVEVSRPHVLLKGPPAGAKTTLFERLKLWYEKGSNVERVTFVDATTASKAGLENWLLDRAESGTLTEILVMEEMEKQPLDNLLTLVSLMGSGYIAKLNARVGFRKEHAQVLVWATCNQEDIIQNFRNGVLWSRFANKLHCTRPSRDRLHQILRDKIKQRGGQLRWADEAIKFAFETCMREFGTAMDDPRDVIALLAGRGRLIDGAYQRDRLDILRAEMAEKKPVPTLAHPAVA